MIQNRTLDFVETGYPIAVYQMGKVGSETILRSLEASNLNNKIYHIHVLSPNNLEAAIKYHESRNRPLTLQLQHSLVFREYLGNKDYLGLKVITGVREPIIQFISAFFQNVKVEHPEFLNQDGSWESEGIYNLLYQRIMENRLNCGWFDNEFKSALDIDVYQYDFNHDEGYSLIETEKVDVLILCLEKSDHWSEIISDFLSLESELKLVKTNCADTKDYKDIYQETIARLKLPVSHLRSIYSSKFCQHFYSADMIEKFISRWAA